jgi:hypothetical protein
MKNKFLIALLAAAILIGSFLYFNGKEKPVNV